MIALLQKLSDNQVCILISTGIGPATYRYGIFLSDGMVLSQPRKCRYDIPFHTVPLQAPVNNYQQATSKLSMGWVNPRVGLGWIGLGRRIGPTDNSALHVNV